MRMYREVPGRAYRATRILPKLRKAGTQGVLLGVSDVSVVVIRVVIMLSKAQT